MENATGHIEIKKIKGNLYAYYTLNIWDKTTKKEIKKSKYIGKLENSMIIQKDFALPEKSLQYGDVALLMKINKDLIDNILKNFNKYRRALTVNENIYI